MFKRIIASLMLLMTSVGFSQTVDSPQQVKIKSAKKMAKKFLRKQRIPGMAISVSQHGELIWSEGFGYANKAKKKKVKPNETQFRIASISKSITAMALVKLVDEKKINLDESIYTYLPDYPKQPYDFTVRQLGGHLAGIRHYKDNNEYALNKKMSITEGLDLFKNDPLEFEPGTQFLYNSFGYVLLSEVIQKAGNLDFNSFVADAIFKPLKMDHTTIDASDVELENRCEFYRQSALRKPVICDPVANEYKVAGGGFLSTSEDITMFGHEIISPTIVSKEAINEVITSQKLKSGNITGYGIGFSVETSKKGTPKYYHTGGGVGAATILIVYPKEELTITVLTNLSGAEVQQFGEQLESVFLD
ncbi:MAG: beta-lactamase family protein [Gelidibacter sp.]|nr:beta-lactamase family protein [Gelidibacter sp.]